MVSNLKKKVTEFKRLDGVAKDKNLQIPIKKNPPCDFLSLSLSLIIRVKLLLRVIIRAYVRVPRLDQSIVRGRL